ncbi:hypothetical protein IRZ71_05690 [Flavobacterium sp. ANB]|uniref:hypothetical protein n=1 Tax=unclassified Flavobacterium TaxID=196869 RepID=UPI0012B90F96|nr:MULTISPECIES: hypothetical protein [unclassified Flavobacterium]MBF4515823.1 hypothetical protein [Flavobacterium sp. ANB]MTD68826.1 hypothetical protein [Flavobacterium sp. LC2016-13]
MKQIKNKLALILLSIITFCSCKNDKKISDHKIKKENIQQNTEENSDEIVKPITLFSISNPDNNEIIKISGSEASDDNNFLLAGDKIAVIVSKFKKNKEGLELIQTDTLLKREYSHVKIHRQHFLRKKIKNIDYFLFATKESPMGNGDVSLYLRFIMLNMNTLKFYTLEYIGENSLRSGEFVDGTFSENETLEHNMIIKKELYEFANQSKWIYKPTEKEKDINYYTNFEHKWYKDNYPGGSEIFYPTIVRSTYYSENLFQFNGDYDDDQVIENADFKIVSYFRNNIIGYDKNKELYFPITVESCTMGCDKEIEFVSEHEIKISYETDRQEADIIDLNKIKFKNSPL